MKRMIILAAAIVAGYAFGRASVKQAPRGVFIKDAEDPDNVWRFMKPEDVMVFSGRVGSLSWTTKRTP